MAESDDVQAIRQSMADAFAQIGRDLDRVNRQALSATSGSGGISKLDGMFVGMARGLLGPVGLAAGLYQISKSLSEVAAQSVQMQAFSRNTGMAVGNIKDFQLQMQMMGKSSQEAKATIGALNNTLNDFNTNREDSGLYKNLIGRTGGEDVINKLNAAKTRLEQIDVILKAYRRQPTERQQRGFADLFPMLDLDALDKLKVNQIEAANAMTEAQKALADYYAANVKFEKDMNTIWENIAGNIVIKLNEISKGIYKFVTEDMPKISQDTYKIPPILPQDPIGGDNAEGQFIEKPFKPDRYRGRGSQPLGGFKGKRSDAGEILASSGDNSLIGNASRRSLSLEEEQTSILTEIRDTLQGRGPQPSGSGGGGGGRGGLAAMLGMNSGGTIPGMPGSTRGSEAGVGAARGKVGAGGDPRGMESYIREAAKARGIDPDTAVAVAKSEGLSTFQSSVPGRGPNGREDSWGAFQLYKGGGLGNEFQRQTGLDPADPANEKATIDFALDHAAKKGWGAFHGAKNTGISRFAGIGGESGVAAQPGSGASTFGGTVLERQGRVAAVRKGGLDSGLRTALDYASSRTGLTADVTSGGQRMPGVPGAVGSHRHDHGRAADFNLRDADGKIISSNDPRAIEFYRYAAQGGVTGGGEGYMSDPNKIHLDRVGSVYAGSAAFRGAIARGQREQEEFQAARARIDAKANDKWSGKGSISAIVDFKNVPPGVSTKAESDGDVFNKLQINKSKQNEVAGGSPGQPYSGVW